MEKELTRRVEIDLHKAVQKSFPKILIKDLTAHERICPVCNGLGMRIEDNVYGIQGDESELGRRYRFPYKHQSLSFCRSCFNGVQRLCPYCGKPYKNQYYAHCDCEGQVEADEEQRINNWNEVIAKAKEVSETDVKTMLYCEEFDEYYSDMDEFFDNYSNSYADEEYSKPVRLWVTREEKIHIDASDIAESVCEDLWEDAYDQCNIDSLQNIVDKWCAEQLGTTTYYPCYKEYVVIDWSKYGG